MAALKQCPTPDALHSFLLGQGDDDESLSEHLLACPQCLEQTRNIAPSDTLLDALKASKHVPPPPDSQVVERVIGQVRDLTQTGTRAGIDGDTSPSIASLGVNELLATLEAPQGPDELARLGDFRLLKLLGAGGMGAVFLAEDMQLKRNVALKLLNSQLARQADAAERFLREARAAAAVHHEHVVTIFQVGKAGGIPFLAQELLQGETLESRLHREGRLTPGEVVRIGRETAEGLAAAHDQGLLHRDIKPSNIWIDARGRVKLLDFGLARRQDDDSQITGSGMIVGTPAYMSPEQAAAEPVDARSDLFSLGCVLYRAATGVSPFSRKDALSTLRALALDTPSAVHTSNPSVPRPLSDLVAQLLAKQPAARPASAREVADRLGSWTLQPSHGSRPPRKGSSLWQWAGFGGAAALLVLLGVIIIRITRPDGSQVTVSVPDKSRIEIGGGREVPDDRTNSAKATFDAAAERRAAQWLLSQGGEVIVRRRLPELEELGQEFWVKGKDGIDKLPPADEPVAVTAFLLVKPPEELSQKLTELTALPYLEYIRVHDFHLSTQEIERISRLPLKRLELLGCGLRDRDLASLTALDQLQHLSLDDNQLTDAAFKTFARLPKLQHLQVESNAGITLHGLKWFEDKTQLRGLFALNAGMTESAFPGILEFSQLESLAITGPIPDAATAGLENLTQLTELRYQSAHLGEETLARVGRLHQLNVLAISGPFNDRALAKLHTLKRLKYTLGLHSDEITDEGVASLLEHVQPARLDLFGAKLTDRVIDAVVRLPKLESFRAPDQVSEAALLKICVRHPQAEVSYATKPWQRRDWHGWPPDAPAPAIAPFGLLEAAAHQKAWAEYLKVPVSWTNSTGLTFRLIPPGEYERGSTTTEIRALLEDPENKPLESSLNQEAPQHRVVLTQPFYLAAYETRQTDYEQATGSNPSAFSPFGSKQSVVKNLDSLQFPVEQVSWNEAAAFCEQLSRKEGLDSCYRREGEVVSAVQGNGYRLPTEAEWEYACRGGTNHRFGVGETEDDLSRIAWYGGNSGRRTHAVGELEANAFGLYDILGNVAEWCHDGYLFRSYTQYASSPAVDPVQEFKDKGHKMRGGYFTARPVLCRCAYRNHNVETFHDFGIGMRLAISVEGVKQRLAAEKPGQ